MRKKKLYHFFFSVVFFLFILPALPCSAIRFGDWDLIPGLRFWGIDLEADYYGIRPWQELTTVLVTAAGFGYETYGYYHYADETLYTPPAADNLALYPKFNFDWTLGIRQGLLKNPFRDSNLLEVYLYYRGLYDANDNAATPGALIFTSGLPDMNQILQNSLVAGLYFTNLVIDEISRNRDGVKADCTFEYVPPFFFNNMGKADYYRLNFDLRGYLTLIRPVLQKGRNLFNLYICDRIIVDYLWGTYIPINARQTVLNRNYLPEKAMGDAVRGIEQGRFDSNLKAINNFDIRLNLPALAISALLPDVADFIPGMVFSFDAGFFDNPENLVYSTGVSFFINALGFDVLIRESYFINESKFSTTFDFALHY